MLVRRSIAAGVTALVLSVVTAGAVDAQVSPPTSDSGQLGEDAGRGDGAGSRGGGNLPTTGSDAVPTILVGAGLAGAGVALVVAGRRRRPTVTA